MKNNSFIIHPSPASRRDAPVLEKRRLKAVRLFEKRINQAEVAKRRNVTKPAVHYWYTTWRKSGKEGVRARRPGPTPQLAPEKADRMKHILIRGAGAAGYDTDLWTLQRIGAVIRRELRLSYQTTQVWYIMRALGWSNQKPETRSGHRNEAAIKRWKEKQWPAIQKRG